MNGFNSNIEKDTLENNNFRKVLYSGKHLQLVLMSLKAGEEIGEEIPVPKDASIRARDTYDVDAQTAYNTIIVLSKIWPAKKTQIEVEIRKLLAELGLTSNS